MSNITRALLLSVAICACTAPAAYAGSFEDALTSAYQNNPRIKAERQRQEATDEGVSQAVSGFRPTIGADYDAGRQRSAFAGADWDYGNESTKALNIDQPLFRGGGTWSSYKAALQRVRAGEYTLSATEQQVLLDSVTAYMNVVQASALLDLSRKNMDVLGEQLKASNTKFQVGEVTRTDVAQSESRLSDAKARVITAEGDLLAAMAVYERNIGVKPEGTLAVPDHLPELPISLDDALERARGANPQLLAAIHGAKAADYDTRTSEAALLPKVDLVGSINRETGTGSDGQSDFNQDRIGFEVTIPIYQAGAEYSKVRQSEATARQRDHQSIDTRMNVDQQVTQSWEQLESTTANITTRNDQIKAATIALDGVRQEQQYGTRTILDILDAEQELFTARTNLVRAQRDRIVAGYTLAFDLGQLTPKDLGLEVAQYDPQVHADKVGWKTIGF